MRHALRTFASITATVLLLGSCSSAPDNTTSVHTLTKFLGDNQSVLVATAVPVRPAVKVTDEIGQVVSGVAVTFAVGNGGGSITGASTTTNADGVATVGSWVLGPLVGSNTLTATAPGVTGSPVTFSATGIVLPPADVTKNSGDGQSARIGTTITEPPSVRVLDANGGPVSGATVVFAVASGGGSVTGATAITDGGGLASVGSWTLGPTPGVNTLTATVSSAGVAHNPVTFTATATP